MLQEILNRKSEEKTVSVKVGDFNFILSAFCYKKVGMTENMKFKLKCKENSNYDKEFDDIQDMITYISEFLYSYAIDLCM